MDFPRFVDKIRFVDETRFTDKTRFVEMKNPQIGGCTVIIVKQNKFFLENVERQGWYSYMVMHFLSLTSLFSQIETKEHLSIIIRARPEKLGH